MSPIKKQNKPQRQHYMPEVDSLLEEAGVLDFESVKFDAPTTTSENTLTASKVKSRKKKKHTNSARILGISFGALAVLLLGGAVYITEPWVPAIIDSYIEPTVHALPEKKLAVGEAYEFEIELSENEAISEIVVTDSDILSVEGNSVKANGEYFKTTANITTMEKALPTNEPIHKVVLFGKDFSNQYDSIRTFLRDLIGVEKKSEPRTELKVLNKYSQDFSVDGMDATTTTPPIDITAFLQNAITLETEITKNQDVMLVSYNEETATVSLTSSENGIATFSVNGKTAIKTKIKVIVGYWKDVTPEVYAEYKTSLGVTAVPKNEETSDQQESNATNNALKENKIFVPQRAIIYPISVVDLNTPVVTTDLEDDGEHTLPDNGYHQTAAQDLLKLINELRKTSGLSELSWNDKLASSASTRTKELSEKFSYTRPDNSAGISVNTEAKSECISAGYLTAQEVFTCWNSNDTQRANMLSAEYTNFGASFFRTSDESYKNYWSGLFS